MQKYAKVCERTRRYMKGETMATAGINSDGTVSSNTTSTLNSTSTATSNTSLDKDAFLQLLVAQMKYQDPLEPADNTEYIAQLATFSQVEELQNVANSMTQSQANELMGKTVVVKTETASGTETYIGGEVERVVVQDGTIYLGVNGSLYDIEDLDSVVDEDFYKKYYLDGTTGKVTVGGAYVDTSAAAAAATAAAAAKVAAAKLAAEKAAAAKAAAEKAAAEAATTA